MAKAEPAFLFGRLSLPGSREEQILRSGLGEMPEVGWARLNFRLWTRFGNRGLAEEGLQ